MIFEENDEDEIETESKESNPSKKKIGSMLLSEEENMNSLNEKQNSKFIKMCSGS